MLRTPRCGARSSTPGSLPRPPRFARLVRIAPTFAAAAATRLLLRRRIDARATAWCAVLGGVWCVFYLFYFSVMRRA